ncbi:auxilin-like clathrin-binding protein required for normal clathrin function [Coemansia sp. RSA 2322]|nr:auxilin-like clathrin-binding protein required for normal clathrin function [Coemansia sp. RSA 2322]
MDWSSTRAQSVDNAAASSSSGVRASSLTPNYSPSLGKCSPAGPKDTKDDPFGELVSFTSSAAGRTSAKMTLRERQQMLDEQSRSSSPFSGVQQPAGAESTKPAALGASSGQPGAWNFDALENAGSSLRLAGRTSVPSKPQRMGVASSALDFDPLARPMQAPVVAAPSLSKAPNTGLSYPPDSASSSDDDPIPMDIGWPAQARQESFVDMDFEIAQIVEYGFSAEQATTALEISGSTRAAIQLLREQQATMRQVAGKQTRLPQEPSLPRNQRQQQIERANQGESSSDEDVDAHGFSYKDRVRGSNNGRGQTSTQSSAFGKMPNSDKLLATANELGSTVWKQANSWFAIGKKKVMELQETVMDQSKSVTQGFGGASRNRSYESEYLPSTQRYRDYGSSSSDDDNEVYMSANRRRTDRSDGKTAKALGSRPNNDTARRGPAQMDDSFSRMGSDAGQPKARTAYPQDCLQQSSQPSLQPKPSSQGFNSSRASSARPSPAPIPTIPDSTLRESASAKTNANEQFKLGQFGDAVEGYASAINSILRHTSVHPILIVLYNNRALAYARNGESKSAVADCSLALELCDQYQGNGTIELAASAGRVDVAEQRAKALQRRAEALEASENYADGLRDWKSLREAAREPAQRQQSSRGIQRCEKALGISQPSSSSARPSPAAATKPAEAKPEDIASVFASISLAAVKSGGSNILNMQTENSAAVAELRKKEQAKRDEDDQRLLLLDKVNAELRCWREGKQHNLRALLSSLHTLLPGFTPIGMHEILEPNKVKRAYMRAISKLHPDKLSQDVDVRTKMVSSSVFSSLNEAWDAFKAQENAS